METQEIKITASITLEVPIELSKEQLLALYDGCTIGLLPNIDPTNSEEWPSIGSTLEIIEIEEEAQIYGTEDQ